MDKYQIISDFWNKKLEEYVREVRSNYHYSSGKINYAEVLDSLCHELSSKYGPNRVNKTISKYEKGRGKAKKEYEEWDIEFIQDEFDWIDIFYKSHDDRNIIWIRNHNYGQWHALHSTNEQTLSCFVQKYMNDYQDNNKELELKILEYEKEEKIKTVSRQSIKTIIENRMKGSGYKWNLIEEETRCVFQIRMKRAKMMEITLGYKTFTDKIPKMQEVIKQIENLLDVIPYPVNIRSYGNNVKWRN